jgi:DNA-binding LacI/PurR family transcriptional regulator
MKVSQSATMQDVAKLAGVSQSTVSRVLNKRDSIIPISEQTQKRVLWAASELSYTPNRFAQALKGANTFLVGAIVREIGDPFFAQMISSINEALTERQFSMVLGDARSNPEEALRFTRLLDARHCDGFLVLGDLRDEEAALKSIVQQRIYVVAVAHGKSVVKVPIVNVNNKKGVALALDYLFELGHRRIAFIHGGWVGDIQERYHAYCGDMVARGVPMIKEYVQWADTNDPPGGYEAMQILMRLPQPPSAVLASDDSMAIAALKAASDMGVRVPEQVSIMGFDDIHAAAYAIPGLTTIRQPIEEIGQRAAHLLIDMIEGLVSSDETSEIILEPELVVRGSCGPAQQA